MEDSEIISLYWARSEDAIKETAQKYGSYCTSISYGILRNFQDAEECVMDTYLRTWNAIPPQRPGRLAAFLGRITRNLSLDRYRKRTAAFRGRGEVPLVLEELDGVAACADSPETQTEFRELTAALERFLWALPGEKRSVFLLRYWYFQSIEEISQQLGMKHTKITSMLFRLRKDLRVYLEKEGIEV